MNSKIQNVKDVEILRYQLVRFYDLPEFNGELKQFVMNQLNIIMRDSKQLINFIEFQEKILAASH